jgi:hypothetical protein
MVGQKVEIHTKKEKLIFNSSMEIGEDLKWSEYEPTWSW